MRCALDFDENKSLSDQEIKAWGEFQSLKDEPCYKESEIKDNFSKAFFQGLKVAFDDVCNTLDNMEEDGDLTKNQNEHIQAIIQGTLCEYLFSILDEED